MATPVFRTTVVITNSFVQFKARLLWRLGILEVRSQPSMTVAGVIIRHRDVT